MSSEAPAGVETQEQMELLILKLLAAQDGFMRIESLQERIFELAGIRPWAYEDMDRMDLRLLSPAIFHLFATHLIDKQAGKGIILKKPPLT